MIRNRPLSGHIGELPATVAVMNRYLAGMRLTPDRCHPACRVIVAQSSKFWNFKKER